MATDADFLAAATVAAQALKISQQALASASQAIPPGVDVQALAVAIAEQIAALKLPAPVINVEAAAAPSVDVHVAAPTVNVEQAAPAVVNVAAPNVIVEGPTIESPTVNVAAPVVNVEPPVVNVAAPSVRVQVPEQTPQPRLPWRMNVTRDQRTQLIVSAEIVPVEA